jgi:hypothetical protein
MLSKTEKAKRVLFLITVVAAVIVLNLDLYYWRP